MAWKVVVPRKVINAIIHRHTHTLLGNHVQQIVIIFNINLYTLWWANIYLTMALLQGRVITYFLSFLLVFCAWNASPGCDTADCQVWWLITFFHLIFHLYILAYSVHTRDVVNCIRDWPWNAIYSVAYPVSGDCRQIFVSYMASWPYSSHCWRHEV